MPGRFRRALPRNPHVSKGFGSRSNGCAGGWLHQMGQRRTISVGRADQRPIHSKPPIAYLVMSVSYLRKSATLTGGTATSPAAGEALGSDDLAPAEAHIDL